ncbi:MAG: phenylalanine--tRNA ligase subunit beta [Planctomycetaceae bacterium]|jgi:phenylalanyl-tRNA synthetase beta chain|nr:phenylalanine--tRNA ligase subunit beta [Planctomycetaceae bacterium]
MYISLDWISDFVDLSGISPEEMANRMTLATAEVESFEKIRRFTKGVITAEVIAIEEVTDEKGKKLAYCTVDCGTKKMRTVCGAPNARIGLKAPFAPAGTALAKGIIVEKSKLAGKESEGILCSAAELGMSSWHEIVFECPAHVKNGTDFETLVPETDILFEIDNKSLTHRPDLWGHYGLARELAAVFRRPLNPLPQHDLSQYDNLPPFPVKVEDYENCPCYSALLFQIQATVPSPVVMQRRLHVLGQRTYNLMVDVTNYVSLEVGQPTHAFDGDLIQGIRVAQMGKKAKFITLDGQERSILPEDLLIWDMERPVALAGIMGGLATEVSEKTGKVMLESANFKAGRVRRTAGRLDLRTDASQRYEKSQPPYSVKLGTARIMNLIESAAVPFEVLSRFTVAGDLHEKPRTVTLPPGKLDQLAGISLPQKTVEDILRSLSLTPVFEKDGTLKVEIPPFRSQKDLSIGPDIVEEILRVYGYDNIPPKMPSMPLKPLFVEKWLELEYNARKFLTASHRFVEVHNYSWMNDLWLEKIRFDPGKTLVLRNPADQANSRLRTTLLPNLLALVPKNRAFRDKFRLFELGRVYFPDGKGAKESSCLSGVSFQQANSPALEEHYLEIKSALEDLGSLFNKEPLQFVTGPQGNAPWQAPDHWVEIRQSERRVGGMGVIAPALREIIIPEGGQIVWFELDMEPLSGELFPKVTYCELPRFPGSWQDFSLVWSVDRGFAELDSLLGKFRHPLLLKREFLVAYKGKGLEKGTASYSFRFWLGAESHTLSGEEIESFHQTALDYFKQNGIALR